SRAVKERYPDLPVVWGGWHPSMFGAECLEEASVDVTVQGQGEVTFLETVDRLARGDTLDGCLGCTYRARGGSVTPNLPRPLEDVNRLCRHDYSLIDVGRYYGLKGKTQLDYITGLPLPLRLLRRSVRVPAPVGWTGARPRRLRDRGVVGPLPLRRRQLPGRDLLHLD